MEGHGPSEPDFLTVDDVLRLHSFIVESDKCTEPGVSNRGVVEYATSFVEEGHYGEGPETIHESAFQLLRLLVANHPFVYGNKRTALLATVAFYALNGYELEYDREIKATLKALGTDERSVSEAETIAWLERNTKQLPEPGQSGERSIENVLRREFRRRRYNAEDDDERNNGH